ncbi:tRNA-binding protein [Fodinibius halophilus]|uniref:tRNA-binding protein n=1 Tax=Fodinibius halophilus TaxID=1736908 RepID=A0A6M1T0F6_9BACT|nr:tRNA-binding protein [Fodinibius halophilus]NGP88966.1 tRNA-binding protein [Fodinibius halophilus]
MDTIDWAHFESVELRIGTIIEANEFPEAHNPAYKLKIDFGDSIGTKKSSAQITDLYDIEQLVGKQVIAVVNLPPKQIGPFISECLVTGLYRNEEEVVLAVPDKQTPNGAKLS